MIKRNLNSKQKRNIFFRMPFVSTAILFGIFSSLLFGGAAYAEYYQLENVTVEEGFLTLSFIPFLLFGWVIYSFWKWKQQITTIEEGDLIETSQFQINETSIRVNGHMVYQFDIDYQYRGEAYNYQRKTVLTPGNLLKVLLFVHPNRPAQPFLAELLPDEMNYPEAEPSGYRISQGYQNSFN